MPGEFETHATLIQPERSLVKLEKWTEKIEAMVPRLKTLISDTSNSNRDIEAKKLINDVTKGIAGATGAVDVNTQRWLNGVNLGSESIQEMEADDMAWETLSVEGKKQTRKINIECCDNRALIEQSTYLALDELGYKANDVMLSAGEVDDLLPIPLKGCGEAVLWYGVENQQLRTLLNRTDDVYEGKKFNKQADIRGWIDYLNAQMKALTEINDTNVDFYKQKQAIAVYYEHKIVEANEVFERIGRREVEIPNDVDKQFEMMRDAVKVFETLMKAPGEGLEIMDQTVVFNAFLLESTKAGNHVDSDVLKEMKARVKNLVDAKAMKSAGGFMPSDRQGLDVVSAIERLRGSDDLLNYQDLDFFFGGNANGLPIKEVWDLRQRWDFGTGYEEAIKKVVADYDNYKEMPAVKEMFKRYGLVENSENFMKMMYDGVAEEVDGEWKWSRPTKGIPFYADRGQVFSEDSNLLRKNVMKGSLEVAAKNSNVLGAEDNFNQAWGIVDLLRYSTAEDIRARINLEGHYTIWEGMSGLLNNLDRAGKLKTSADLYWVGQHIAQMGAPYLCYTMRHDIFTPIFAEEINPLAFLDPKTDLSYWSSWVKTTQKASDYLNGGLDQKSLGSSLMAIQDVIAKSLKAPTIVNLGTDNGGFVDNMAREKDEITGKPITNKLLKDTLGRRVIDKDKNEVIEKRLKNILVRQAIRGLIELNSLTDGMNIDEIVKNIRQLKNELTMGRYSDIKFNEAPPMYSTQPDYTDILQKAEQMNKKEVMKSKSFMTESEFDQVIKTLGFDVTKLKERGKDAIESVVTGLLNTGGGKKK